MSTPLSPPQHEQPSIPISFPIKNLDDLESRSYFRSFHYPFNKASVPLPSHVTDLPQRPRILVCHDLAGGYKDDRWVQGGDNPDAYAIRHWHLMDVFVYFSHDLVSIPPPCWTNTAHRHGVKVLGTFITEWDAGKVIADKLLSTKKSVHKYAELLVELAVALGFDGWLINMEVKLDKSQISNMKEFLSHLTQTMHSSLPGSLVIWYDCVTVDGDLCWQNQLNSLNKPFFDLCDGIFMNYVWKAHYPMNSARASGKRQFDLYMGIDVFGRGTFGGGQWNVNRALDVLKNHEVSAAIFAPGWVYETKQLPNFQTAQNRWWNLVEKSWGGLQLYPKELPFYSNFSQGHGCHFSVEGLHVYDRPWHNLSCQSFQPVLTDFIDSSETPIQICIDSKGKCYSGGGKLTFSGALGDNTIFRTRIFKPELYLGSLPVQVSYSMESDGNSMVGLCFQLSNTKGEMVSILIASDFECTPSTHDFSEVIAPSASVAEQSWIIYEAEILKNGYTLKEIQAVCFTKGKLQGQVLYDNMADTGTQSFHASVGHISIHALKQNDEISEFPPANSWFTECQNVEWSSNINGNKIVSVKISWKMKEEFNSSFPSYNIYVKALVKNKGTEPSNKDGDRGKFVGVANVECFYISRLEVPLGAAALVFIIQACGLNGNCQKLDDAPAVQLMIDGN